MKQQIDFFFVKELGSYGRYVIDNQGEYSVAPPYALVQDVIDAARFRLMLPITKFSVVQNESYNFIELHRNGIKLCRKGQAESNCEFISLEDFQAIETQQE